MGALHEGHLSLVREAARITERVVVTIFVNPTQFGPGEDFEKYPRNLEQDGKLAFGAGASIIFAPAVFEMYPRGEQTRVRVEKLTDGLCGASRPGHFEGVTTVVSKLFNAVGPGAYFFGKKDYQQWRVIERMAQDLLFDVQVVGMPIVREEDGLAMSSRNTYLSAEDRVRALSLSRGLFAAESLYQAGERSALVLAERVRSEMTEARVEVEYVEVRDSISLAPVTDAEPGVEWVLAVAGKVGSTRLIDNLVLSSGETP
jgi:pantoate--beta-alanine ligase